MIPSSRVASPPKSLPTVTAASRGAKCHLLPPSKASLDWDSPSGQTGTVKRRPNSQGSKEATPTTTSPPPAAILESCRRQSFTIEIDIKAQTEQNDCERGEEFPADNHSAPADKEASVPNRGNMKNVGGAKQSKIAVLRQKKTSNLLAKTTNDNKSPSQVQQKLKNNLNPPKKLVKQSTISGGTLERREKQSPSSAASGGGGRSQKKVSFIPSLAVVEGGNGGPAGTGSASIKSSTVKAIVRSRQHSLSDTGVQFKELYRDFPAAPVLSDADQVNTPPPLPPYREPPPAPCPHQTAAPSSNDKVEVIQQDLISMEPVSKHEDIAPTVKEATTRSKLKGFGLSKLISSAGSGEKKSNNYVTLPPSPKMSKMSSKSGTELPAPPPTPPPPPAPESPENDYASSDDILTKPEFSSLLLKNLPVRQRKGTVPHLENYCLFDPSVDFFNEKEHKMRPIPESVELADPILYQNPLIYDAVDRDSDNYFTLEPDGFDVEAKNRLSLEKVEEKIDEIFNKTRTSSSSSGSSPDYPSMVNSVIETPSSNLESTDESDYGFRNRLIDQLKVVPKSISGSINEDQQQQQQESSYYGVVTKTAVSQFERLHHRQSTSLPNSPLQQRKSDESSSSSPPSSTKTTDSSSNEASSALGTLGSEEPSSLSPPPPAPPSFTNHPSSASSLSSSKVTKIKSDLPSTIVSKVNFLPLLSHPAFSLDSLKSSISLPHLQKSSTGAISKNSVLSHLQPSAVGTVRNGSLDSTPLFSRLRKQRPLSSHSDADSGFLSPVTPPEATVGQSIQNQILATERQQHQHQQHRSSSSDTVVVLEQCDSIQELIQIYTDWANYYLERAKSKKKVSDLAADCRDGLLLAEVIEAVTTWKVPDLVKKPKTPQHMYDNVNSCLNVLRQHQVGGLDSITANDISSGRLKAVLLLFFALSRYKQPIRQKTAPVAYIHQQQTTKVEIHAPPADMTNRQLPVPYAKPGVNGGTAIPQPATVMVTRRCPPDKVRPLPPTPNQQTGLHPGLQKHSLAGSIGSGGVIGPGIGSGGSGNTPLDGNSCPGSPQHNGTAIITQIPKGGSSSLRIPQSTCKIPASPYATQTGNGNHNNNINNNNNNNHVGLIPNGNVTNIPSPGLTHVGGGGPVQQKQSMLEKLKLFNSSKDKQDKTAKSTISKRTSSSSGFSSARSERSDSSLSLNEGPIGSGGGGKVKESAIKKTDTANNSGAKLSSSVSSSSKSSKLISSKSGSSKDAGSKVSGKLSGDKGGKASKELLETHIPITPKSHKIPTALTTSTNGIAGNPTTKTESKLKPAPVGGTSPPPSSSSSGSRKLDAKSESKTSLLLNQQQSQVQPQIQPPKTMVAPPSVGTGIPKPMAAVKGTSKPSPQQLLQEYGKPAKDDLAKLDRALTGFGAGLPNGLGSPQHHQPPHQNNISNNNSERMHVVNPISVSGNNNVPGSPLHKQQQQQIPSCMSDSMHSNSTQGASVGQHSNSSESSSVVYRPSGSESGSEHHPSSSINSPQKSSPSFLYNDVNLNNTNNNKFNTVPNKILNTGQQPNGTIYEQEEKQITVVPMRPLLRGYNSHVTLPTRGARGHHFISEYCEDLAGQGYCSDGDALRKIPARYSDSIENGYLSEGGGSGGMLTTSAGRQQYISALRNRTPLPTTIEERCRSSRGDNLDCVGDSPTGSTMDGKLSRPNSQAPSGREFWGRLPEPSVAHNGHGQQQHPPQSAGSSQQGSQPPSPTSSRKDRSSPGHSRKSGSSSKIASSRTKGVPQSFGYVKKTNGAAMHGVDQQGQALLTGGRTAHVSAVPRTSKLKVSGGTQTTTADFQAKNQQHAQYRSFSLTGPGAAQLSQSVKERFGSGTHSLPKPGLDMHVFQHRMSTRGSTKLNDGSLSDTQTYAEVKPDYSSYAMWLRHSSTASSRLSEGDSLESFSLGSGGGGGGGGGGCGNGMVAGGTTGSGGSGIPGASRPNKLLHHARGETQPVMHHHGAATHSPRLNRSNSISYLKERTYPRSTKSEKMYPSMLSRGPDVDIEPYYCLPVGSVAAGNGMVPWSQPTSPTPPARGFGGLLSPTHTNASHRLTYPKKNDEVHGSQASLLSGGSSLYGSAEERQATEVRRLKRELADARDQVMSLSSQLSTNAHVVAAFEQSLSNMTQRLQMLTATTEKKDSEILDMRQTIELLRKQSIQAGLTTAHMQSMGVQVNGQVNGNGNPEQTTTAPPLPPGAEMQRHHSSDSMCSLNSVSSGCSAQDKKKKKGWLRSSFTKAFSRNAKISKTNRHISQSSNLDQPTATTGNGHTHHHHHHHHHHHGNNNNNGDQKSLSGSGSEKQSGKLASNAQLPPASPTKNGSPLKTVTLVENAKPIDAIELNGNPVVEDLKKQLREKDLVLTDIRLEALSSASQLESLKDTLMNMRQEMMSLKQSNERLQRMMTTRSLAGSEVSLGQVSPSGSMGEPRRYSLAADNGISRTPLELPQNLDETEEDNIPPAPAPEPPPAPLSPAIIAELSPTIERAAMVNEMLTTPAEDVADPVDGKKIAIAVYLGQPESFAKYAEEMNECDNYYHSSIDGEDIGKSATENGDRSRKSFSGQPDSSSASPNEFTFAYTYISGKTTWQNLDYIVRKTFKDYLGKIDPGTNLGLNTDSITSYHLGEAKRGPEMGFPELLPCGYIIGNVRTLYICLQGVGSLAFDSLILRNIVHRYISLLTEHRRLILCGPSGTGKSYLARKLAEFLVARSGRDNPAEAIATFNVDHKSSKELQQYLGHIAEQASMSEGAVEELPAVIILDNLHHASALGDVFSCLLSATAAKLPCIIGTMSQATCNTTNLQLHHNFRWVLTANHMEPVKGFLGRYLRRKLFTMELQSQQSQPQLEKVLKWLPSVWQHINSFLETHNSSDVTIGPRLFLSCPMNLQDSQVWFTDVWNYHLAPYLMDAVREGVQLYGRRGGTWVDPCTFIRETYPWPIGPTTVPQLRQITADDVGLEASAPVNSENQDPLMNMLLRLQEAANYNGNQEPDSDCASLDSNMTHDSSAGVD
ncbi:protein sickie-like [Sabethes cyaneus]|uniref:protein sickie-like n=1 Tax=Sabethes cyaneus TaxID=53552 RepID=UPI00237E0667|nr:protein sickie-like [Sabethes cyaneus]